MVLNQYLIKGVNVLFILLAFSSVFAQGVQDTSYWKTSGQVMLNVSQVSLSNWIGGGKSSVAGISKLD